MVEKVLNKEQISPPVTGAHLIESLIDVIDRDISNIGIDQIHGGHDNQVKWSKTQIPVEEQFAKELTIFTEAILTNGLQLLRVPQKIERLQEATEKNK